MRLLFLTFYFRPDLCAGAFRATPLVEALVQQAPADWEIDVISTLPNRYRTFTADAPEFQRDGRLSVWRIPLPPHESGMLDQSRAFFIFGRKVRKLVAHRQYDIVVATSSRLMTAVLAAAIARRKNARLYLDIRDIFVDTIQDVLPAPAALVVKPVFSLLERLALRSADKVNLVSPGFAGYFRTRYPDKRFSYFTNGVDEEFLSSTRTSAVAEGRAAPPLSILYAGNIGEGQGLHEIIPELARRMQGRARFTIIGDGGRRPALAGALSRLGVTNVELHAPLGREELIQAYVAADVLFMHLNDYRAFEKVLPSKIFEYAALGKPIWAGVAGYAAEFMRSEVVNSAIFRPCDVESALQAFDGLDLRDAPRAGFAAKYARSSINRAMAADIIGRVRDDQLPYTT